MAYQNKYQLRMRLLSKEQLVFSVVLAILCLFVGAGGTLAQPPSTNEGLFNKQGQIKPNQRFWTVKDGKLIPSHTAQELQELERKARESTEIPIALSTAEFNIIAGESSALVKAKLGISTQGAGNTVRRFELQLKNCHLIEDPTFNVESGVAERDQVITTEEGYRWHHLSQTAGKHSVT
ncbi:MAG: hypothetical protein U0930_18950 [Pirellulales bacterium]